MAAPTTVTAGLGPTGAVLANGATVIVKRTRTTPAVTIHLALRAGSICDPPDAPGATYLLSRMIDRGTATRSADQIADELDGRGVVLTIGVTRHLFSVVCTCLAEHFEPVMALLADLVVAPTLPEPELATRKGEIVTQIRQDEDNPAVRAMEALMALLYPGDHPYGRRTKGTPDTVAALSRSRLMELHASRFGPGVLTAAIVGDVDADQAIRVTEAAFGAWSAPTPPDVPVAHVGRASLRQRLVIPMMNKAQADIAYGFTTIARADPAYYAYWLMNHALGQYSMSGRLGMNIRERQGMAYYVFSSFEANVVEGPLVVRAGVGQSNVDKAIAAIDAEIGALVREGLTPAEVDDSRQYLVQSLPRALETNAGIANFIQNAAFFGLGLDYDVRLPGLLEAVTLEEVNAAARRSLDPDRAALVVAGPYEGASS
jgi:zinc protease